MYLKSTEELRISFTLDDAERISEARNKIIFKKEKKVDYIQGILADMQFKSFMFPQPT